MNFEFALFFEESVGNVKEGGKKKEEKAAQIWANQKGGYAHK
ncbi:hypothetical protein V3Q91_12930 [Clostridioides difficile]